ncbi:hypothetical protein EVAR_79606_1 [Eumeta japonica]|uniref:Uncharacterized protein n=1 Tax=Eumeta variegata TaxID=151549 RepID=A0A4C1UEK0_EUMVA|nr:hypothetical protein EVAR_79606_1 [Eumeta japonica]
MNLESNSMTSTTTVNGVGVPSVSVVLLSGGREEKYFLFRPYLAIDSIVELLIHAGITCGPGAAGDGATASQHRPSEADTYLYACFVLRRG